MWHKQKGERKSREKVNITKFSKNNIIVGLVGQRIIRVSLIPPLKIEHGY